MSFSTILSAVIEGLQAELIHVEADVSNGLPVFHMVGYLSSEVREAGERVRTAIKNSGYEYPAKRTVINLSPAALRKRGASFDLPIAVAILVSLGQIPPGSMKECLVVGELSLSGHVKKVPGILPIVMEAAKQGITRCIIPGENVSEGALVKEMTVIGVKTLREAAEALQGRASTGKTEGRRQGQKGSGEQKNPEDLPGENSGAEEADIPDFSELRGQEHVRRAAEIAVAGGHNMLMIGPPGSGKSMAARCIAGILPPLDEKESMEITKIYSVLGLVNEERPLIRKRPFREVHHTATRAALTGGGAVPRPGEISLAHGGVLFLDELPEFRKNVLEVLRQPLEERCVQISRTYGNYRFPANFMLVAAMNPCPCGCYPDLEKCTCTPLQIRMYLGKISRPFLDRIDLCAEAPRVDYRSLTGSGSPEECSAEIRKRITKVRKIQADRYRGTDIQNNAMLRAKDLKRWCRLDGQGERLMEQAYSVMGLTARGYHRIIKTARTIADLEGEENIGTDHLKEALSYRMVDEKYWRR